MLHEIASIVDSVFSGAGQIHTATALVAAVAGFCFVAYMGKLKHLRAKIRDLPAEHRAAALDREGVPRSVKGIGPKDEAELHRLKLTLDWRRSAILVGVSAATFLTALIILTRQSSALTIPDSLSSADHKVNELHATLNVLMPQWDEIHEGNPLLRAHVFLEGSTLAGKLLEINDADLRPDLAVDQHEYASYAYMMAADAALSSKDRTTLAKDAIVQGNEALQRIESIKTGKSGTKEISNDHLRESIQTCEDEKRIKCVLALAMAIDADSNGGSTLNDVRKEVASIDQAYPGYLSTFNLSAQTLSSRAVNALRGQ